MSNSPKIVDTDWIVLEHTLLNACIYNVLLPSVFSNPSETTAFEIQDSRDTLNSSGSHHWSVEGGIRFVAHLIAGSCVASMASVMSGNMILQAQLLKNVGASLLYSWRKTEEIVGLIGLIYSWSLLDPLFMNPLIHNDFCNQESFLLCASFCIMSSYTLIWPIGM